MKAVRSPSCKLLFDFYHSQISEGHMIYNFDKCFDEVGYIQTGDTPGRKEPGTGETNYRNIFKHIHDKGFTGILGMEHGNSMPDKAGEDAVIAAYRAADDFPTGARSPAVPDLIPRPARCGAVASIHTRNRYHGESESGERDAARPPPLPRKQRCGRRRRPDW